MAEEKKNSISEELSDMALKNSVPNKESRKIKSLVNCSRGRKCRGGSSINSKDKRRGKVRRLSELEVAVENILRNLGNVKQEHKKVVGFTDMILDSISRWPEIAAGLDQEELIPTDQFHDKQGNLRVTVPWMNIALMKNYRNELVGLLGKGIAKINKEDLRKNTSSLFTQFFKVFGLLGLAEKEEKKLGLKGANVYQFDERVFNFSPVQLHYLLKEGRKLQRRIKHGELKVEKTQQRRPKLKSNNSKSSKRVIEIAPGKSDTTVAKRTIEIPLDGKVIITDWFK